MSDGAKIPYSAHEPKLPPAAFVILSPSTVAEELMLPPKLRPT